MKIEVSVDDANDSRLSNLLSLTPAAKSIKQSNELLVLAYYYCYYHNDNN